MAPEILLRLDALAAAAVMLGSCGSFLPEPISQPGTGVSVSNATTLEVTIIVNGAVVRRVPAGAVTEISPAQLPPLPWSVEARSPSGRFLVSMAVRPGDVVRQANEQRGTGARVDLSCGRLDIWSGPPMLGPVPRGGVPGECVP